MPTIAPEELRRWIADGQELAILDAREEGEFGVEHLFWAVPCPLSRCEIRARELLPNPAARCICVDGGGGEAGALATYLAGIGMTGMAVLAGGLPAWKASGGAVFSGVNVPSKAFGEWVEHHYGTESVDARELNEWLADGRDLVVLDSRTREEFTRMAIPRGISVPGGELAYRIADFVQSDETTIVVNCAGRTRSIMGAESLRRLGLPNRIVALRNGTMGWELAGLVCERGATRGFKPGRPARAEDQLARARAFAEDCGVGVIGALDLARFEEDPDRTCYVLDVRDPTEFAQGHRPGSRSAPGGQLVQATDQWIAVRGARIALIDDDGVRARMAAAWLRQMGHRDVFVVEGGLAEALDAGPPTVAVPELDRPVPLISARDLVDTTGAVVVDFARSLQFREGHIPGAVWAVRSRLAAVADMIQSASLVVLTSPDGALARLAHEEAARLTSAPVRVLDGGTKAWTGPLEADRTVPADADCIDAYLRPYDRNTGVEAAMQAYLDWEVDLVRAIRADPSIHFGIPGPA